jgi:hypothetical protein
VFKLDERERFMFDHVAQEHTSGTAADAEFFAFSSKRSKFDPLYSETVSKGWDGPFKLKGIISQLENAPEVREGGLRKSFTPTIWFARTEFEAVGARQPRPGDVVRVWDLPYWNQVGVVTPPNPIDGLYFNITVVTESGFLFDSPAFVGFSCNLARNTEFAPERRVYER